MTAEAADHGRPLSARIVELEADNGRLATENARLRGMLRHVHEVVEARLKELRK